MLKILIVSVIYCVIITSTDSRNMNMSENKFINARNSSKHTFKTRSNNTDEESKNVTTSEHITYLTSSQNSSKNSNVSNINQTSAIEDKSININENKTKEVKTGFNNTTEGLKNITVFQNISLVNLTGLQNKSEKSTVHNQTSVIEDKSIHLNETKTFLDPLGGETHEQKLTSNLFANPENITSNINNTMSEMLVNRISTIAILTLTGPPG